jgi:hypothetical protein
MQADEQEATPRTCSICGEPMKLLKQATNLTMAPIYVCDTVKGKAKMPCDGNLYKHSLNT